MQMIRQDPIQRIIDRHKGIFIEYEVGDFYFIHIVDGSLNGNFKAIPSGIAGSAIERFHVQEIELKGKQKLGLVLEFRPMKNYGRMVPYLLGVIRQKSRPEIEIWLERINVLYEDS